MPCAWDFKLLPIVEWSKRTMLYCDIWEGAAQDSSWIWWDNNWEHLTFENAFLYDNRLNCPCIAKCRMWLTMQMWDWLLWRVNWVKPAMCHNGVLGTFPMLVCISAEAAHSLVSYLHYYLSILTTNTANLHLHSYPKYKALQFYMWICSLKRVETPAKCCAFLHIILPRSWW